MKYWFLSAVVLLIVVAPSTAQELQALGQQTAQQMELADGTQLAYLQYLPSDYDPSRKWPLLLFLHGSGERGSDLEKVKIHGPPKLIAGGKSFPLIVISPQCPSDQKWETPTLIALLDKTTRELAVDSDRIYVTGLSMGGAGTWKLAAEIPDRLAAIAPICGSGDVDTAAKLAHLPIWAFHGGKDTVVPLARSEAMIEAIKKCGGTPKFTVYPEAGHDSWTETYDNPKFFEWLLSQRRSPPDDSIH